MRISPKLANYPQINIVNFDLFVTLGIAILSKSVLNSGVAGGQPPSRNNEMSTSEDLRFDVFNGQKVQFPYRNSKMSLSPPEPFLEKSVWSQHCSKFYAYSDTIVLTQLNVAFIFISRDSVFAHVTYKRNE